MKIAFGPPAFSGVKNLSYVGDITDEAPPAPSMAKTAALLLSAGGVWAWASGRKKLAKDLFMGGAAVTLFRLLGERR